MNSEVSARCPLGKSKTFLVDGLRPNWTAMGHSQTGESQWKLIGRNEEATAAAAATALQNVERHDFARSASRDDAT